MKTNMGEAAWYESTLDPADRYGRRLKRIKPFKAVAPEQTIANIRGCLLDMGLSLVEKTVHVEDGCYAYCLVLKDNARQEGIFQTIGKGMTDDYARASAYGEMIERIQNLAFYMMLKYPTEPEITGPFVKNTFKYYPDEIELTDKELYNGIARLLHTNTSANDFIHSKAALGAPFRNIFGEKIEYLPIRAFQVILGSNGMCSGNTPAEALIHGICEVFERYVLKQFFLAPFCPPDIPLDMFAGHAIHKKLIHLSLNYEYAIYVKDCSLGSRLPVIGLLIRDRWGRYAFHLGCDPSPITALERCLTEMYQGGQIFFRDANELEDISGDVHTSEYWRTQLHLNIRGNMGHWPIAVVQQESDNPFPGFDHPVSVSDDLDLEYILGIIKDAGWDLLIRDNSFLGIPSYHVFIPGISEMANIVSDAFVRQYLLFDRWIPVITNPMDAFPMQREAASKKIEQYALEAPSHLFRCAEYLMYFPRHPFNNMSPTTLKEILLKPEVLDQTPGIPACFKCETCCHTKHCSYTLISSIWERLKQKMITHFPNQNDLRNLVKGNIAGAINSNDGNKIP